MLLVAGSPANSLKISLDLCQHSSLFVLAGFYNWMFIFLSGSPWKYVVSAMSKIGWFKNMYDNI